MHENAGKLIKRSHFSSKETIIHMLYIIHNIIWISVVVLQQSPSQLPSQSTQRNAAKSSTMDIQCFSNIPHSRNQSHFGLNLYLPSPQEIV